MYQIMVDLKSRKPIYEQLIESVRSSVVKGFMKPDEPLPSVRQLAGELAINPNTIQKAYAELERQGIVYSVPGKGSFISSNVDEVKSAHNSELMLQMENLAKKARDSGISLEELISRLSDIWR